MPVRVPARSESVLPVPIEQIIASAYSGKPISELAKEVGFSEEKLRRHVSNIWPHYNAIYRAVNKQRRAHERWRERLLKITRGEAVRDPTTRRFVVRTLPYFMFASAPTGRQMLYRNRFAAYKDIKLIELMSKYLREGKFYEHKYEFNALQRRLGTASSDILLLLTGLMGPDDRRLNFARRKYRALVRKKGGFARRPQESSYGKRVQRADLAPVLTSRRRDRAIRAGRGNKNCNSD